MFSYMGGQYSCRKCTDQKKIAQYKNTIRFYDPNPGWILEGYKFPEKFKQFSGISYRDGDHTVCVMHTCFKHRPRLVQIPAEGELRSYHSFDGFWYK